MDDHLRAVDRVYGPKTWEVYDLLDRGLEPRGPDSMLELAIERLTPESVVLDVGCRDAAHLIDLARTTGASGVGIDLEQESVEAVFARAGLAVTSKDPIGTEWREYAEERTQPVARDLLRLARLRRQRDRIVEQAGAEIYEHIESNLHWSVYQFLGKLLPIVYVLRKDA